MGGAEIMKYFKDKTTGEVYAYENEAERQEWGAPELVEMTPEEVGAHLNPKPTEEQLSDSVRAQRDGLLNQVLWRIDRYERQIKTPDTTPDDDEVGYLALLVYAQQLRDVPQQPGFPDNIDWPVNPIGDDNVD